ncbi:MAG: META domain-containing protein [Acidimicrobiales bacterium]
MKRSKVVVWWVVGAVAVIAAASGCGSNTESTEASDDSEMATGLQGPVMRHIEPHANQGEDAEVRGVVQIEGDCLYIALDEIGERFPIIWPASTSWDADAGRVLLPNGDAVGHGDAVYGGGGYYYVRDVEAFAGAAAAARAGECVDNQYGEIAVVNNEAKGIRAGGPALNIEEPSVESVEQRGLDGEWLVDDLIVDGAPIELSPSWPIAVAIEGGAISGTSACNRYVGAIDWSAEGGYGRFVVSELGWTKKACEAQAMEIEQSFLDALRAVDSYEAADGLYVATAGGANGFHLVRPDSTD